MRHIKIFLALLIFLLGSVHSSFAQITADEALSKFVAGGMAYKDGQYDTAISRYRDILDGGRESGAVYYNLGNSYFRHGEIGKAILNYERAKKLIPRDSDLNFNNYYARARVDSYSHEEGFFNRAVKSFAQFYTADEMTLIIVGLVFVMGVAYLLFLYIGWSQLINRGIMTGLMFVLVMFLIGTTAKSQLNKDLAVVVTEDKSYFEPRDDSTVHFKLPEGMKAKILRSEGRWIKIRRLDGKVGWASRDVLERISL